jgi:hypothetical protein
VIHYVLGKWGRELEFTEGAEHGWDRGMFMNNMTSFRGNWYRRRGKGNSEKCKHKKTKFGY